MNWFNTIMWGLMVFLAMVIGLYAFSFFLVPDLGDPAFKSHFSTIPMRRPATRLGFSSLAVFWFYSGMMAYIAIRSGNIKSHQQWMIRCYALTLAGVTLRLQLGVFQEIFELDFDESYDIGAWFSWIPNLVLAEWLFIQSPLRKAAPA